MSAINTAITGMNIAQERIGQISNNIANVATPGYKSFYYDLKTLSGQNGVSGITQYNMDVQGALEYTGLTGDLATSGKGLFIVQDKLSGNIANVLTGSFQTNKNNQLEYLDQYLLMGVAYNEDGILPSSYNKDNIEVVTIDPYTPLNPQASSKVSFECSLNASILATGQTEFILKPQDQNNIDGTLIDLLTPTTILMKNGFTAYITGMENDKPHLIDKMNFIYGGIIQSKDITPLNLSNAINDVAYDDSNIAFSINQEGIVNNITFGQLRQELTNNSDPFTAISNQIANTGIRYKVNVNNILFAPTDPNNGLTVLGILSDIIGTSQTIDPTQTGFTRFSSMQDLASAMEKIGNVETNTNNNSVLFKSDNNVNFQLTNLQSTNMLLLGLGVDPNAILYNQGYNPYSTNNMASGKIVPDMQQEVVVYDSIGGMHTLVMAFKRVPEGFIQETFMPESSILSDARIDGLVQVSLYKFNQLGQLESISSIIPDLNSEKTVSNPFTSLGATIGQDITVNANNHVYTFTYNNEVDIENGKFNSMVDLANCINYHLGDNVAASIVQTNNGYSLKVASTVSAQNITITSNITDVINPPLGVGLNQTIASALSFPDNSKLLPNITEELTLNFVDAINVQPIVLNFNIDNITAYANANMYAKSDTDGNTTAYLSDFSINANGDVIAIYNNGLQKPLYRIPLAVYANESGLTREPNNLFLQSADSGSMQIVAAGQANTDAILSGSIEQSNVELSRELANLIGSQQNFNASTQSFRVSNELLDILFSAV